MDRWRYAGSDPLALRLRLGEARVMLLFTPELCGEHEPLAALEAALPSTDVVQIRPKPLASRSAAPCSARESYEWGLRVLDLCRARAGRHVLVVIDDRVDVAAALAEQGCAGVHLGQDDAPPELARALLGAEALIGWSTHDARQVASSWEHPVDYLGFGPVHATRTKGYGRGLGAEAAWIASSASPVPLFAIGGIDATNVADLGRVGRIAVGSAILAAPDPARAAGELRELLLQR
jgi:thiamine-phosphate pyrophosphorylase